MSKIDLHKQILLIFRMSNSELEKYAMSVSMSDIDTKPRRFLNMAIDIRRDELNTNVDLMCEHGEFNEGDFE